MGKGGRAASRTGVAAAKASRGSRYPSITGESVHEYLNAKVNELKRGLKPNHFLEVPHLRELTEKHFGPDLSRQHFDTAFMQLVREGKGTPIPLNDMTGISPERARRSYVQPGHMQELNARIAQSRNRDISVPGSRSGELDYYYYFEPK